MDRARLVAYLNEGLSLEKIGVLESRHPSTVSYWVRKHGLEPNGALQHSPRGGIGREALAALTAKGLTLSEIAGRFGVSQTTVRYWIQQYGLTKPVAVRRAAAERALAAGRRTVDGECKKHGPTQFVIENSGRVRCRRCRVEAVSNWRRRAKAKLVAEAGGRCVLCGYDRCVAALQFHHTDPGKKEFALSNAGVPRSIDVLREEASKCMLLCGNCHAEVEAGVATI